MKKSMWLMAAVLAMSTTAWGFCPVTVSVPEPPELGAPWEVVVEGCIPGTCEEITAANMEVVVRGRLIIIELLVECECCTGECTEIEATVEDLPGLQLCGLYFVVVRVYRECICGDLVENTNGNNHHCCPWQFWCRPILCGIGSTYFQIWDEGCCWPWWNCLSNGNG